MILCAFFEIERFENSKSFCKKMEKVFENLLNFFPVFFTDIVFSIAYLSMTVECT